MVALRGIGAKKHETISKDRGMIVPDPVKGSVNRTVDFELPADLGRAHDELWGLDKESYWSFLYGIDTVDISTEFDELGFALAVISLRITFTTPSQPR